MSQCPVCGNRPGVVSHQLAPNQEACTIDDCPVITWDSTVADSAPDRRES